MLALRFANGIFEPIWNRQFIDHVQITVAESIGIEGRAAFYEQAGAIRDIFQNHLLQLVALTAMEPPIDFTADSVRNEKVKVLQLAAHAGAEDRSCAASTGAATSRARRCPATARSRASRPTRRPRRSSPRSSTSTTGAGPTRRSTSAPGKRLPRRETTIAIQFKRAPHPPFEEARGEGLRPNVLLIHVQPDEGVSLAIGAKVPGAGMTIRTVHMDFLYGGAFRTGLPEAYERLILDAMLGDATLFTRTDEVEEQWSLVDAIVAAWQRDRPAFPNYAAGTWGPGGRRRADPPRRPLVATALSAPPRSGRATTSPSPRSSASSPRCATVDRAGRGARPADERDDAHRVGAAGLARGGARARSQGWPSGTRRGRSCSSRTPTTARPDRRGASTCSRFRLPELTAASRPR